MHPHRHTHARLAACASHAQSNLMGNVSVLLGFVKGGNERESEVIPNRKKY